MPLFPGSCVHCGIPRKKGRMTHIFGGKGNEIVHTLPLGSQLATLSKYSKIQSERKYEIMLPEGSGISWRR